MVSGAPFPPPAGPRDFYAVEARYPSDHGVWLIRVLAKGSSTWIGHSATDRRSAPGHVIAPARAVPAMPASSWSIKLLVAGGALLLLLVPIVIVLEIAGALRGRERAPGP